MKIIVIDDDFENRSEGKFILQFVKKLGFTPELVKDGGEEIEVLKRKAD